MGYQSSVRFVSPADGNHCGHFKSFTFSQIASRAEEEERLAALEEEARLAKSAAQGRSVASSSSEREKIDKIVEEVGRC